MSDDIFHNNPTDYRVLVGSKEQPLGHTALGHPVVLVETVTPDEYWQNYGWLFQMTTYFNPRKEELYKRSFLKIGNADIPAAAAILAVDPEGAIRLINAYRHAIDQYVLELPSGFIEEGETVSLGAVRELAEETGHVVDENLVKVLGEAGLPYFLSNERTSHSIVALTNKTAGKVTPDADEHIGTQAITMKPYELLTAMLAEKDGIIDHTSLALIAKGLAAGLLQLTKEGTLSEEELNNIFLHALRYVSDEDRS